MNPNAKLYVTVGQVEDDDNQETVLISAASLSYLLSSLHVGYDDAPDGPDESVDLVSAAMARVINRSRQ